MGSTFVGTLTLHIHQTTSLAQKYWIGVEEINAHVEKYWGFRLEWADIQQHPLFLTRLIDKKVLFINGSFLSNLMSEYATFSESKYTERLIKPLPFLLDHSFFDDYVLPKNFIRLRELKEDSKVYLKRFLDNQEYEKASNIRDLLWQPIEDSMMYGWPHFSDEDFYETKEKVDVIASRISEF